MSRMIYADNAATTRLDDDALQAMLPWLQGEYGNASQPYAFARKPRQALLEARRTIAECINANPEEIIFTSCGSESDNWAIKCASNGRKHSTVITSQIEHHAILNACNAMERAGDKVVYLPVDTTGTVLLKDLSETITDSTRLVSIMMVNNEIGTVEPIRELADIAHAQGALFHTDAVQAVGHIPIDVQELGVDLLSASGHKFNGPKGIGFLYVKHGTPMMPLVDGGAQEYKMRAGTENIASIVAMATALKKNCDHMTETAAKLENLEREFLRVLAEGKVDFYRNGAKNHAPGNISISIRGASGEMLLHRLDLMGICISTGSACDSVNTQLSHVIRAIKVKDEYAEGTIRISFGRDNTVDEAVAVAKAISKIIKR